MAAFAAGDRHPLFALVRADMSQLIGAGRAVGLQDAYDKAVAARLAQARVELSLPPAPAPKAAGPRRP